MNYFAITIDIKNSRNILHREHLQQKLQDTCRLINTTYTATIVSEFDIILGDEVQGLISSAVNLVDILELIRALNTSIYIGIGYGSVETLINAKEVEKNDGPCFHFSREAIQEAKKQKNDSLVILGKENFKNIESLINLYFSLNDGLSDHANEILKLVKLGYSQSKISTMIGSKQSSISRTISRSRIMEIVYLNSSIKEFIHLKTN